jgi:hypothetical protein
MGRSPPPWHAQAAAQLANLVKHDGRPGFGDSPADAQEDGLVNGLVRHDAEGIDREERARHGAAARRHEGRGCKERGDRAHGEVLQEPQRAEGPNARADEVDASGAAVAPLGLFYEPDHVRRRPRARGREHRAYHHRAPAALGRGLPEEGELPLLPAARVGGVVVGREGGGCVEVFGVGRKEEARAVGFQAHHRPGIAPHLAHVAVQAHDERPVAVGLVPGRGEFPVLFDSRVEAGVPHRLKGETRGGGTIPGRGIVAGGGGPRKADNDKADNDKAAHTRTVLKLYPSVLCE